MVIDTLIDTIGSASLLKKKKKKVKTKLYSFAVHCCKSFANSLKESKTPIRILDSTPIVSNFFNDQNLITNLGKLVYKKTNLKGQRMKMSSAPKYL